TAPTAVDIALRKFIGTTDRVNQFESHIRTSATSESANFSPFIIQVYRKQIGALWEKVEKSYESCTDLLSGSADSTSAATVLESKYNDCYSVYSRCVAQLQETAEKGASQSTQTSDRLPPPPS
ncbi:hypothetical protein KR038_011121, partial [Drosophila bunnanda]